MRELITEVNSGWSGRLLSSVAPVHYNLTLRPNIDQTEYTGHVDIKLEVKEITSVITFNADGLSLYNVQLRDDSQDVPIYPTNVTLDNHYSTASLEFQESINISSKIYLSMDFNGTIHTDTLLGFYRSSKTNGNIRYSMLSTQFESHYARKAFPCWDEPDFKATFDIRLEIDNELTGLSNTDIKHYHEIENNKKHILFHTTPKMSAYTVAFAVGEFEFIEEECWGYHRSKPIRCRIYTLPGDSQLTYFAMNVTKNSLAYFENELQSPYQLDKLDLIAVPKHDAAAMENWGLITFQDNYLLHNESIHTEARKSSIAKVIAHELAHQWFGNLVTMKWWSDFWLNEGLANYFGLVASDFLYPEYGILNQFHDREFISLMKLDISSKLITIRHPVLDPPEFSHQANKVIYNKGAIVMSMLNHTLTKPIFMHNIRQYLRNFQYRSASAQDFYTFMLTGPGLDIFSNWIEKPDFPYLNITERISADSNSIILDIEQHRFNNGDDNLKTILLNVISTASDYRPQSVLLNKKSISVTIPRGYAYKINTGLLGYYHIKYPFSNIRILKDFESTSQEILSIVSDSLSFIEYDMMSNAYFLPILKLTTYIKDQSTWISAIKMVENYFNNWSHFPKVEIALNALKQNVYQSLLRSTGREIEQEINIKFVLQYKAFTELAHLGDKPMLNQVAKLFNDTLLNKDNYNSAFQKIIFQAVLNSPDPYYYQSLLQAVDDSTDESMNFKYSVLNILPFTNTQYLPAILKWYLKNNPKLEDFSTFFYNTPPYPTTLRIIWNFIAENWAIFKESYAEEDLLFSVQMIISGFILPDDIQMVNTFLAENVSPELFEQFKLKVKSTKLLRDEPDMIKTLDDLIFEL